MVGVFYGGEMFCFFFWGEGGKKKKEGNMPGGESDTAPPKIRQFSFSPIAFGREGGRKGAFAVTGAALREKQKGRQDAGPKYIH